MTVKELIAKLLDYNMNAEISVIAHCREEEFTLSYGNSEGVTKENCETVSIYIDRLCTNEQAKPTIEEKKEICHHPNWIKEHNYRKCIDCGVCFR